MGHTHKKGLSNKKSISSMTFQNMGITEERVRLFFESKKPSAIFFKYSFIVGFFMLIAGIVMDFIFLFIKKEIITEKISEKKSVSWGIMDIIRVTIIVIFSTYMLSAAGYAILKPLHFNIDVNLHMLLGTFFIDVIAGAVILYFVLVKYKEKLSSIGVVFEGFYKNVLSGIVAYIFIMPILAVVLILSMLFLDAIGYKLPPQPVFDMFFEEKRGNVILLLTIFVSILGPIIEEIFFRGFLYSAVRKRFGIFVGVLLSSALFSMLHTNIVGFLPIMILGVLMAFLYEITGSLIASMSIHILHNSIIVGFVFFIKEILK
jgi:membrane protease YdiL (CAAX protease family)